MRHRQKRMPSYFELVMNCLLALLIIFAGAKTLGHHVRLCRQCSVEVEATIKDVWTSKASDKDFPEKYINIYIPVYTYSFEGEEYDSPSNWIYLRKNKFHAGEKVKLNIDPDAPKLSHADVERGFLILGILMIAMGVLVVIKIIKTFIRKMKHIT